MVTPRDSLLTYGAMLCFGAAWLIPVHFPPWGSFYNDYAAFLGLLCLLALCARLADEITMPVSVPLLALVSIIPLGQFAFGQVFFAGDAWIAGAYLLAFALAMFAGYRLARLDSRAFAVASAWVVAAAACVSAAFAIYQSLDMEGLGAIVEALGVHDNRAYANLAQANQLATLLCLGLGGLLYLHSTAHIKPAACVVAAVLLVVGVALTQSRAPWPGAAVLAAWWLTKRRQVPEIKGGMILAGVVLYAGLMVLWAQAPQQPLVAASAPVSVPSQRTDLTSLGTHLLNWQEMARAVAKEPWTGYGWNQVSVAHVQSAHERHTYAEMLTHSHNLLLDLLVWNGLPLGLLLIGVLGVWLMRRAWRCRTPEAWFAFGGLAFVGAHAMLEYPLEYAYFLIPIGLLCGLIEAEDEGSRTMTVPKPVLWGVLGLYVAGMVVVAYEYRLIEQDYRRMRFEERRIATPSAQIAPEVFLLTQLREDIRMGRSLARDNMSAAELEWMRKITYRYPWYSSLFRYSVALALNGRRDEASIEFRRLYDIYGAKPYARAKDSVRSLAETKYPELKDWRLPPP